MLHRIENEYLTVTVAERGAELQSILGQDGTEYLWQGDSAYWCDRAPTIFPYVGRLKDGRYRLDGETHEMEIHGFAPYCDFSLGSRIGNSMVLELTDSEAIRHRYPRRFVFRVIYSLRERTLEVTYEVENRDERAMYFGLGGHPGFNVPLSGGRRFEEYSLRFSRSCEPKRIVFDKNCFVSGERVGYPLRGGREIPLSHDLFDEDAVVLTDVPDAVTLTAPGDPRSVTVTYPGMRYVGFWHWPKRDAPYVCIEPWCSLPASAEGDTVFEEQRDLICLLPGETCRNLWTISVT